MIQQHTLRYHRTAYKKQKRVGRGNASGHGTFSGRGCKGQLSRTGKKIKAWFEGGQTPFMQKVPKDRGAKSPKRKPDFIIHLTALNTFDAGTAVTLNLLQEHGLVSKKEKRVKILGDGEMTKKLTIHLPCSQSAKEKIEKAGGQVILDS